MGVRDRVTKIAITFENADGSDTLTRTYHMDPVTVLMKGENPQGKIPGRIEVKGYFFEFQDTKVLECGHSPY